MTDVLDRLRNALADRYTIERELGRGGMATGGARGGSARTIGVPRPSSRYAWSPDGMRAAFSVRDSIFAYAVPDGEPELPGVQGGTGGSSARTRLPGHPTGD